LDCNVGDTGCKALGEALQKQKQPGLMTLNLNCNPHISNKGVSVLCDGLFLNTALKQLHLDYCGVGVEGAVKLAQLLSMPRSVIDTLSLRGNELGNQGLFDLSLGLARSHTLTTLNISDNGIRNDHAALEAFRTALQRAKMLANVDLTYNHIEADGASVLLPAFTEENNHKIKNFFVDATLPAALFAQLNRATGIGDGKTKRGKKKKGGKKK
jgi:Ran GTPase-activating protein (RanGAP) involved in mRNA processing and transport